MWLVALVVVSVLGIRGLIGEIAPWLLVHLLLLGAVSNAILVWSTYFSAGPLRLPPTSRRDEARRLGVFNSGALTVMVGMTTDSWIVALTGAVLAATAAGWHAVVLMPRIRGSLPSRFGATVRYYVATAGLLRVGITLGVILAPNDVDESLHARLVLAHVGSTCSGGWA